LSIIEKKKGELTTNRIINIGMPKIIDRINEVEYIRIELEKLRDVEQKNIKLALQLKEIRDKYNECKNQNNINTKLLIEYKKLDRIDFKFMCPELGKEIMFHNCCDACYNKLCKGLYQCETRLNLIKDNFRI
jgi:hypothetical protein